METMMLKFLVIILCGAGVLAILFLNWQCLRQVRGEKWFAPTLLLLLVPSLLPNGSQSCYIQRASLSQYIPVNQAPKQPPSKPWCWGLSPLLGHYLHLCYCLQISQPYPLHFDHSQGPFSPLPWIYAYHIIWGVAQRHLLFSVNTVINSLTSSPSFNKDTQEV